MSDSYMAGTCDTCVFWGQPHPDGDPRHTTFDGRLRLCGCPKFRLAHAALDDLVPDDGGIFEDDEGWAFQVGPKFGCIHHARKDQEGGWS